MRIAIIGAGNVGTALSKADVAAGHTVSVSAADQHRAAVSEAATGARAGENDLEAVTAVADEPASAVRGKIVVDATNPLSKVPRSTPTRRRPSPSSRRRSATHKETL